MQELRILHLEDDPFFADMVEELLKAQGMRFRLTRAADWDAFESALHDQPFDLILSDHNVPGGDGLKALSHCRRECPNVPFIFLSGMLGEELAIESLKNGAADYVLKSNMSRFIPMVMRTLNAFRETAALRAAEARIRRDQANLHGLIENTTDAIWSMDLGFNILVFNSAASLLCMKMTGQPMVEGSCLLERLSPGMQSQWEDAARRIRNRDRFVQEHDLEWAGGRGTLEIAFHPITSGKAVTGMAMFGRDVTDRKRLERAAVEIEGQRLRLTGLYRKMRIPLHGLTRMAGLLGRTVLDDTQRRYIAMMGSSVRRLADLHARAETFQADLQALLPGAEEASAEGEGADSRTVVDGATARNDGKGDPASLRILVVEDNAINRMVVKGYLESLGLEAAVAVNGREGVEACERNNFDLILMDCQMPLLDGFSATAAIRELEAKAGGRAWIAAMTANAMPGTKEKCLACGMDAYTTKPVSLEILRGQIAAAQKLRALGVPGKALPVRHPHYRP
ncbi:MAG: diguanylate cyclase/phosphodiesterase [Fibrobacteres bacterium]|nr:diguanylate cyclase/phosphodiesterase [Fibrobacterota bacterium]